MRLPLPDRTDARGWRRLYAFTVALAMVLYIADVFVRPAFLGTSDVVIHDDARQFLTWMPRLADPLALRGDWMADFWQSVSPPAYRLLYALAAQVGIAPTLFARLLPLALLAASACAGWRLAATMRLRPPVAFCSAAFLMALLLKEDSIFSATPRGLAVPFLLFFLDALLRDRWRTMAACLIVLATTYPSLAVVSWTILAFSRLRGWQRLAGGWRDIPRLAGLGMVVTVLLFLFREQSGAWGPVLTLQQALNLPGLAEPGARSAIVDASGRIDHLCSMRMGFLPEIVPCDRGIPLATLLNLAFLAPLLWLAMGSLGKRPGAAGHSDRLYLWALTAALVWFVIATVLAFRLHLPSRYSQRLLYPLEWLAIGQMIGQWLHDRLGRVGAGLHHRIAGWATGIFLLISFATPLALLRTPDDPAMIRFIRTLPAGSRISGVSTLLDFVPALTGRAVEGTPQHAIPWQYGYYRRVMTGLDDSLAARATTDPERLRQALLRSGGTHILIARPAPGRDPIPPEYADADPAGARAARKALTDRPSLLLRLAPGCRVATTPAHDLLSTACVLDRVVPHALNRRNEAQ